MTDYECPGCGGGFPAADADGACPWCGEGMADGARPETPRQPPLQQPIRGGGPPTTVDGFLEAIKDEEPIIGRHFQPVTPHWDSGIRVGVTGGTSIEDGRSLRASLDDERVAMSDTLPSDERRSMTE